MDSGLVDAWDSDERVDLGTEATRIPVGGGFAGIIGDGSVNDKGWIEVSHRGETASPSSASAASPMTTRSRMHWPIQPTKMHTAGGTLTLPGGELALFSSALDEVRDNSMPLVGRRPGRRPGPTGRPPCPRPVPRWSQDCW